MVEHYREDFSFTPLVSGLLLLGTIFDSRNVV